MFRASLLAIIIVEAAVGQATWKGLRFGATEAEVRKEYQGVLQPKQTDDHQLILMDNDQKLGNQRATANLYFDKSIKLSLIEVFMKDPTTGEADSMKAAGLSFALITVLGDSLSEKYGKPITEEGECRLTLPDVSANPAKIFTCNKTWKAEGQTVALYWSVRDQRLTFYGLTYKPLPSDI
jgi:hypothetical protein